MEFPPCRSSATGPQRTSGGHDHVDEPSANLDAESEKLVIDAIRTIPSDITVITIAHRLSTIREVDRVAVLDRGMLVAAGNPRQVASSSSAYRMLMMDGGEE